MPYSNRLVAPLLVLACGLDGCSSAAIVSSGGGTASAAVTGSLTYRERISLAPTAVIKVKLVDVSRADAPARVLGEQQMEAAGRQVPFTFSIPYDPAGIDARMSYAVQARIEDGSRLLFVTDRHYAVLTRGAPQHVDLVLKSVRTE